MDGEYFGIDNILVTGDVMTSTPSMVPVPASWATMIAGFDMVGASLRRRRQVPRLA